MLILSVQDVKPCGVQRGEQQPTFGFHYQGQCFDFITLEWMNYTAAVHSCRAHLDTHSTSDAMICLLKGVQGYRLCLHDGDLKQVPIEIVLQTLCESMAAEPGFVDTRRWRLRSFDRCFVGHDAVTWLERRLLISRQEALLIGQACLKMSLFSHVLGEQDFADEQYFYRFRWDGGQENRIVPTFGTIKSELDQFWGLPDLPPAQEQDPESGVESHAASHFSSESY